MIYKSKENQTYFRNVMQMKICYMIYKNFYEDILGKNYLDNRNGRNVLSQEISTAVEFIQFEKFEPIDFGDGKDIDVRDIDPPSSCWFSVKNADCEIVLDSRIETRIDEVIKLQEKTEKKQNKINFME